MNASLGEPPSQRIASDLRREISDGRLLPGAKLPSERELADRYATARNTAREAVRILAGEGLIVREHGRGNFVRQRPRVMRFGAQRYSHHLRQSTGLSPYRAEVMAQGFTPSVACTSIVREQPPIDVAESLGVDADTDSVVRRENWYYADDNPVQVGHTYIPWSTAGGTVLATSADLGPGSIYARFEDLGHRITRIREEVTARMPTPAEVEGLRVPHGTPVLRIMHSSVDQHDIIFEVTIFIMRADLTGLDYTIPVEN